MNNTLSGANWEPIVLRGRGPQPNLDRDWDCVPAWDIVACYEGPDAWISLPPDMMWEEKKGERRELKPVGVFWDRHIDPRFHVSYVRASRERPRFVGRTVGEALREWDILVAERDRILCAAGVAAGAPGEAVARTLANSFAANLFEKKPLCTTFPTSPRALDQAIEGLLHKSHCVGCAKAFEALADSMGFDVRTLGCGAHRVAEVRLDGGWRLVDSVGRHAHHRGLDCLFKSSFHDSYLDPMGNHGDHLTPDFRLGLLRRDNPQFHFHDGMWGGPRTLRWAASCARALYPENRRWGFKGTTEMPISRRAGGFYWPCVHESDVLPMSKLRFESVPDSVPSRGPSRDYLFFALRRGKALRDSFWLGDLGGMKGLRVTLTFAWSRGTDFSAKTGAALRFRVNGVEKSLAEWGAWPPCDGGKPMDTVKDPSGEMLACEVRVPVAALRANAVNGIALIHEADTGLQVPCVPAVLEPHLPSLGEAGGLRR